MAASVGVKKPVYIPPRMMIGVSKDQKPSFMVRTIT